MTTLQGLSTAQAEVTGHHTITIIRQAVPGGQMVQHHQALFKHVCARAGGRAGACEGV